MEEIGATLELNSPLLMKIARFRQCYLQLNRVAYGFPRQKISTFRHIFSIEQYPKIMENYEELYEWVETHPITRPKRNINRDFSDAIPLVEILKYHFPKLVQEHNYAPRNSLAHKITNWQTLNNKVLKKLKISLSMTRIEHLAKGEPGCIEQLLKEVKQRVEKMKNEEATSTPVEPERNIDMKTLPLEEFEQMENDLKEKNESITILQNKLERLTSLLNTKDERIRELTKQLETLAIITEKMNQKQNTRFFGLF